MTPEQEQKAKKITIFMLTTKQDDMKSHYLSVSEFRKVLAEIPNTSRFSVQSLLDKGVTNVIDDVLGICILGDPID